VNPKNLYGNCLAIILNTSKEMLLGISYNNICLDDFFNEAVEYDNPLNLRV
jgi:hypothetical protein